MCAVHTGVVALPTPLTRPTTTLVLPCVQTANFAHTFHSVNFPADKGDFSKNPDGSVTLWLSYKPPGPPGSPKYQNWWVCGQFAGERGIGSVLSVAHCLSKSFCRVSVHHCCMCAIHALPTQPNPTSCNPTGCLCLTALPGQCCGCTAQPPTPSLVVISPLQSSRSLVAAAAAAAPTSRRRSRAK